MTRILMETSLGSASTGEVIEITGDELHYLKNVRRHGAGDTVILVDNDSNSFEAVVLRVDGAGAFAGAGGAVVDPAGFDELSRRGLARRRSGR